MECSICLNLLTKAPSSLISQDLDARQEKSNKGAVAKPSRLCCTPCGHVFHRSCLLTWLRTLSRGDIPQNCPVCRKKVVRCKLYPVHLTPGNESKFGDESQSSNEANTISSSGKVKLTTMRSLLQRIFFCVSPSPSSTSTASSNQEVQQQLQVAVTISGVIPVSEAHSGANRMCDCPCPNHHAS